MPYPAAPRQAVIEQLHGIAVADPYRWLEDPSSPETHAWLQAQDGLLAQARQGWEARPAFASLLRRLTPGVVSEPSVRGDRLFFYLRDPDQEHAVYLVREPGGEQRVLIDPAALDPTLTTVLDGAVPSKDGTRLAYLLSSGGREESVLHVMDVASRESLQEPVMLGRGGDVAWSGSTDFVYCVRRLPDSELPPGEEQFHRRVWRHRVGAGVEDDELLFGQGRDRTTYYGLNTSLDGRWLVVSASLGTAPRNDVYLLDTVEHRWITVQEGMDVETWAAVGPDGRLYLMTNRDAPRWRLCVVDPDRAGPAGWEELLAEEEGVLTDFTVTDDCVVAVHTDDVVSRVTVHDRLTGRLDRELALPGLGVAGVTGRPEGGSEVWIGFTDYTLPRRILHLALPDAAPTTWAVPPGADDIPALEARRVFYASTDGTRVPMFIVTAAGGGPHRSRPAILYGYGGFNVALAPAYSARFAAWAAAGGVVAVANLRGGSEYGESWHRAGMRAHKQNVFDDFLAAARWLVDNGWTTPDLLAGFGGSNGGLLVGAALTQSPEQFRAVVCGAPLLDMVRYERFGLGQTWNDEYGRADDPAELSWLLSYSPYHHVHPATAYPAVLFTVFDGDTRVDPLHARKMCAALQAATTRSVDEAPVLLRRETDVGHGARAVSRGIDLQADELAFLADQLGLEVEEPA